MKHSKDILTHIPLLVSYEDNRNMCRRIKEEEVIRVYLGNGTKQCPRTQLILNLVLTRLLEYHKDISIQDVKLFKE